MLRTEMAIPFPDTLPDITGEPSMPYLSNMAPLNDLVSYKKMIETRKLYLDSEIGDTVLGAQRMILLWNKDDEGVPVQKRQPIYIYIFSYGGAIDYMWSLVDTIETSETPIYTINMGVAASAASLIFLAGHKRMMMPRSRLLIHEGSAQLAGDAVKVMDATQSYKKVIKQMKDYVLQKTTIPAATLNRQRCHDWELDADYCLANGACEKVVKSMSEIL